MIKKTGSVSYPFKKLKVVIMDKKSFDQNKALLNIEEFCKYVGIGKTNARKILSDPQCTFSFWIGNRVYANKKKLDDRLRLYRTLV